MPNPHAEPTDNHAIKPYHRIAEDALALVFGSLSDTSKRQYQHTFKKWRSFCIHNKMPTWDLSARNVLAFLHSEPLAHSTRQARLSHLRKLLTTMHASDPANRDIERMYKQSQLISVKRSDDEKVASNKQTAHALTAEQIYQAFAVFSDDTRLHARNRCLLAILFYGGLRRAEAAVLRWADIDLDTELLTVQHGKGDKARTIPLLGGLNYIRHWQKYSIGRTFVFCSFRKGDNMQADKPMSAQSVYEVIKQVELVLDIEGLSPHDARRTLITNGLNNGASVADMQFIAGHANPQTTLNYAQVKDAKEVAGRVKGRLGY
ncbi:MAG: site-specific integrase [Chloroflexota bacterium]